MDYLLDTNIVLIYSRANKISREIEKRYKIFNVNNRLALSVVSLGELDALIKKLELGESRIERINSIIEKLTITEINKQEIISAYGNIDMFSQGKLKISGKNSGLSSRNMGKNDLWIAASAKVYDLTLVTTDKDFNHLQESVIDVLYVDIEEVKNSFK